MAGFFSTDSKLYRFMCRLTDLVKLNFMWIICSLPIVTLGVSTIAASAVSLKIAEGHEGYIARDFLKAFKENLRQGIPMTFISLVSVWAVWLDFQIFRAAEENAVVFLIIGIITAYILGFSQLYVYPLLARYENTVINSLKNSFKISMKYFFRSLLVVIITAFEAAVMLWNFKTMILILLIGPAFINLTICSFAIVIFRELEKILGTVAEKSEAENSENSDEN